MPHSLRVRLKKIYEKGLDHYLLTDRDVERLIHALDVVDAIEDIKAEIIEEKDFAYADFEQYKVDILGVDSEYVEDELPYDDFRYGMERCIDIIRKHMGVSE